MIWMNVGPKWIYSIRALSHANACGTTAGACVNMHNFSSGRIMCATYLLPL